MNIYTYNFKSNQSTEYKRFENAIVWYQKLKNGNEVFTEFGKYTVGESGAIIFEVLEQKQQ